MISGTDIFPERFRDIFNPKTYSKWYYMVPLVPIFTLALAIEKTIDFAIRRLR